MNVSQADKSFATCSNATLKHLISEAKKGKLDLNTVWKVGDSRKVVQGDGSNGAVIIESISEFGQGQGLVISYKGNPPCKVNLSNNFSAAHCKEAVGAYMHDVLAPQLSELFDVPVSNLGAQIWWNGPEDSTDGAEWMPSNYHMPIPPDVKDVFGVI